MDNETEIANNCTWKRSSKFISKYTLNYYFYIHIILLIPLATIQLRFCTVYKNDCTIDDRIILYLFIIGIIQLIHSFNGFLLIIFSFLYEKHSWISAIHLICFLIQPVLLLCFFIGFLTGNYLVFHIRNQVQYTNAYDVHTFCNYSLYQTAFWTTIVYYIIIILFSICFIFSHIRWFIEKIKEFCRTNSNNISYKV